MSVNYCIIGFKGYVIKDKILYRKAYITKSKSCKFQYRNERKIKRVFKGGIEGYFLNNKFHSLKSLKHRLKLLL